MNSVTANQAAKSAASRLFSSSVFRELATKGRSPLFAKLLRESNLIEGQSDLRFVRDVFDFAFGFLQTNVNRDEYVYKAALTHNILLGTHSLKTASMLTEFRVGDSKADLVILNGTAAVYEIKSERDSLGRLEKQIESYKKVFARVYVVAGENHVEAILNSTSSDVGVMGLSNRRHISTFREAEQRPDRICPATVLDSIRTDEAKLILKMLAVEIPDVPNTLMRTELHRRFVSLKAEYVHVAMTKVLKKTRSLSPLSELVRGLPPSLSPAALTTPLKKSDHQRLIVAINSPLECAMNWGESRNVFPVFSG